MSTVTLSPYMLRPPGVPESLYDPTKTAIKRKEPSLPVRMVEKHLKSLIIDYGCGYGVDCSYLRQRGYSVYGHDPGFNCRPEILTDESYETALLIYVLNVIEEELRLPVLQDVHRILGRHGALYIAVRDSSEKVSGVPYADGVLTSKRTFQCLFTPDKALDLVRKVFPSPVILSRKPLIIKAVKGEEPSFGGGLLRLCS